MEEQKERGRDERREKGMKGGRKGSKEEGGQRDRERIERKLSN